MIAPISPHLLCLRAASRPFAAFDGFRTCWSNGIPSGRMIQHDNGVVLRTVVARVEGRAAVRAAFVDRRGVKTGACQRYGDQGGQVPGVHGFSLGCR